MLAIVRVGRMLAVNVTGKRMNSTLATVRPSQTPIPQGQRYPRILF
jgi:hypothetical protein